MNKFISNEQRHVIKVMNFSNILEWFDVYSFSFLADVLRKAFFPTYNQSEGFLLSFLVFGLGFVSRPIGGVIFGRVGDLLGRKKSFMLSISILSLTTFLMGIVPTYNSWGIYAPLALVFLRFVQAMAVLKKSRERT